MRSGYPLCMAIQGAEVRVWDDRAKEVYSLCFQEGKCKWQRVGGRRQELTKYQYGARRHLLGAPVVLCWLIPAQIWQTKSDFHTRANVCSTCPRLGQIPLRTLADAHDRK